MLAYNFYYTDGGTVFHAMETYRDAGALGAHMVALGDALGTILPLFEEPEFLVCGEVPDEMKAGFAELGPTYGERIAGFTL